MPTQVAVCGPRECPEHDAWSAYEVGRILAERGAIVLCEGYGGIMAAAASGARDGGGITVGVLPGPARPEVSPDVWITLTSGIAEAPGTIIVNSADAVIVVGGSWGTLYELAMAKRRGTVPVITLAGWQLLDQQGNPVSGLLRATNPHHAVQLALGTKDWSAPPAGYPPAGYR